MLYSRFHNKDTNEDPKTSDVFGNLMALETSQIVRIIRSACLTRERLPLDSGDLLGFEFWPHWSSAGTSNEVYVEPDVFIRFEKFDLIVEAKVGDGGGQYFRQWTNEFSAYLNEYGGGKKTFLLAVGGNESLEDSTVKVDGLCCKVFKTTWLSLMSAASALAQEKTNTPRDRRCFANLLLAFRLYGLHDYKWLDSLATGRLAVSDNIDNVKLLFKWNK